MLRFLLDRYSQLWVKKVTHVKILWGETE